MRTAFYVIAAALLLMQTTQAIATDFPLGSTVYGTVDNDSLTYTCTLPQQARLHCSFVQVIVSMPRKAEEFASSIPALLQEISSDSKGGT